MGSHGEFDCAATAIDPVIASAAAKAASLVARAKVRGKYVCFMIDSSLLN
jgi:hypothetical protein